MGGIAEQRTRSPKTCSGQESEPCLVTRPQRETASTTPRVQVRIPVRMAISYMPSRPGPNAIRESLFPALVGYSRGHSDIALRQIRYARIPIVGLASLAV